MHKHHFHKIIHYFSTLSTSQGKFLAFVCDQPYNSNRPKYVGKQNSLRADVLWADSKKSHDSKISSSPICSNWKFKEKNFSIESTILLNLLRNFLFWVLIACFWNSNDSPGGPGLSFSPWLIYPQKQAGRVTDLLMSLLHVCTPAWYTEAYKTFKLWQMLPKIATINSLTPAHTCPRPIELLPLLESRSALWALLSTECSKGQTLRIVRSKHQRTDSFHFLILRPLTHGTLSECKHHVRGPIWSPAEAAGRELRPPETTCLNIQPWEWAFSDTSAQSSPQMTPEPTNFMSNGRQPRWT